MPAEATQAEIKKAFRKLARAAPPGPEAGRHAAERRFKEINEANEVLSDPDKRKHTTSSGANWEALLPAGAGAGGADPVRAGRPVRRVRRWRLRRAAGGNVRYEFRTAGTPAASPTSSGCSSAGPTPEPAAGAWPAHAGAAAGARRAVVRRPPGEMGFDGADDRRRRRPAARPVAPAGARAAGQREAEAEISLEEAFHGTKRLVEVDGKRLEVNIPPGVDTGSRIRLAGRGGGGRDLFVVTRVKPHAVFTRHGADLHRELAISLARGPARRGGAGQHAQAARSCSRSRPAPRPAGSFRLKGQGMPRLKGDGAGDLYAKVRVAIPTKLSPRSRGGRQGLPRPRRPARPPRHDALSRRTRHRTRNLRTVMQLDRFTEKAQEAIVRAQELAQGLHSPILDAEHILSALIEPDDGVPAETLRRLGVDLPGLRGEIAAVLARRARIEGGSLSVDPRAKRVIELAQAQARRLSDDYVSTEHLLLGVAEAGGEAQALLEKAGAGREAILGALQGVRGGQRVTSANPEAPTRRSRSTGAT